MSQLNGCISLTKENSLKGIVTIRKDENGMVGLEVEGLFKINNLLKDNEDHEATKNQFCFENEQINIYHKKETGSESS